MNKITSPITPGTTGGAVANLQEGLRLLLEKGIFQMSADEQKAFLARLGKEASKSLFGDITQKLVGIFQEQHHLEASGQVDEPTAAALNNILDELGAFDQGPSDSRRLVAGQVSQETGLPAANTAVRAFHADERGMLRLGADTTDAEGNYTINYAVPPGVSSIQLRVAAYDAAGQVIGESDVIQNAPTLQIVNLAVKGPAPDTARAQYTVNGKVGSPTSAATGGLRVVIVDKGVGEDLNLAEAATDDDGAYLAIFDNARLLERGKQQPDLQARVFTGETFLAASEIRYNANTQETLNVLLANTAAAALQSEHETLQAALSTHIPGRLGDLQETDERQDITYLANKTGWDARAVAMAALSDQFSARTAEPTGAAPGDALEPAFFYALFRAGLPANGPALYQAEPKTVETIWKQSLDQGVIPARLADALPQAVEQFQQLAARQALDNPALVGASSLKEMVSVSLGEDAQQQATFANLYVRHRSDPQEFWNAVSTTFGEATEKRLRLDGQLGYLTLNNAALVRKLHDEADGELTSPQDLVAKGFYQAQKWQEAVSGTPVPPEIPGKDEPEKKQRYAELLAAQFRLSYPTAIVTHTISTGETPLADAARAAPVSSFLAGQQGKFEIGMQPVEQYVKQNELQVAPEIVQEVTRIQRVYQITPGDEAMNALLTKGIDSAFAVTRFDQDTFVSTMKESVGGEDNARLIYNKAVQVHTVALNVLVSYLNASNAPGVGVHSPAQIINPAPVGASAANAGDVIAYSTLESLFGELDFCTCEHCRSVLSPAAYLVDLLQFLDREPAAWTTILTKWKIDHGGAPYPFASQQAFDDFKTQWNQQHPAEPLPATEITPLDVLLARRPDLQHLPLTCENTNTPLPYIDLVNEALEYYITNQLSLDSYTGHTTDEEVRAEELMANPQFVSDQAYSILAGKPIQNGDPLPLLPPVPPLPFHQPLENLRRYFDRFEAPLPVVMEALRKDDSLERASEDTYAWRDIHMEELGLSRAEYALLTDKSLSLAELYGYPPAMLPADVLSDLSNARSFTRRVGITYEEIVEILKTRFVNPNSTLIPRLERLGVPFTVLKKYKDGGLTDDEFDALIRPQLDPAAYGGDIHAWVKDPDNQARIMSLLTLADPEGTGDLCSFDRLRFVYTDPDKIAEPLPSLEFVRLFRFIRLWKKLGWTIAQTDKAISALYPHNQPLNDADDTVNLARLDAAFLSLLPRLGIVRRLLKTLNLKAKRDLLPLLAAFAPLDTHGEDSLYRQMFLSRSLIEFEPVFADDGYGRFLGDDDEKLVPHAETLRSAFQLTGEELGLIFTTLGYDANTLLAHTPTASEDTALADYRVENISAVYRRGWLARTLKLSVQEFLLLVQLSGHDPFAQLDPVDPSILLLVELVSRMRAAGLKPSQALWLIWNQDLSGKSAPAESEILEFVRTLRSALTAIDTEFALLDDPEGKVARERMALVYGIQATDTFFGLLENSLVTDTSFSQAPAPLVTSVPYTHTQATLEQAILDAAPGKIGYDNGLNLLSFTGVMSAAVRDLIKAVNGVSNAFKTAVDSLFLENGRVMQANLPQAIVSAAPGRIAYDDFRKRLTFTGLLDTTRRDALKAAGDAAFKTAVDELFAANQKVVEPFFARFPELLPLYSVFSASNDPIEKKRSALLANFLPELKRRRKRQQALQTASAAADADLLLASAVLENKAALHAVGDPNLPALDNLVAAETAGLSARLFFNDSLPDPLPDNADLDRETEANLDYRPTGNNKLPANPTPNSAISGLWSGYLEAPENGFFNFRIEPDAGAAVALSLDGKPVALTQTGDVWSNTNPIELRAGTLLPLALSVEKVKDRLSVRWETAGRGWEIIPAQYLYPQASTARLRQAILRFMKTAALSERLKLSPAETSYLAALVKYQIGGAGWLNSLPVAGTPDDGTAADLRSALLGLLDYARIKAAFAPDDERLLEALKDPLALGQNGESLLIALTRWEPASLDALLAHFGMLSGGQPDRSALGDLDNFTRIYDAHGWVKKMGVPAAALARAATNEPTAVVVRELQAALRARYAESDWLDILKPINDEMRDLQRNALVAYILHQMRSQPATEHIDTPEKLFEFFLMDVQMEPCTQTSRIRHALSSIQLFIERCLMNLEPRVAPSVLNAKHWEWMKRYRVWEANRKVFLYPENWLEPELRDDQSTFFKETMSELLQSDITEDTAAVALLTYLSKLEEVAKLEPCGIFVQENEPGKDEDDVVHVVARTAGANRKYYYRRLNPSGWTPWEQIKLDVEDNPVIPVVWKGRLFLFWLKILQQAVLSAPSTPPSGKELQNLDASSVVRPSTPRVNITAALCWSEFYNGKWQPTKTSDVNHPALFGSFNATGSGSFNRAEVRLSAFEEKEGLRLYADGSGNASFLLYNTHSLPSPDAPIDVFTIIDRIQSEPTRWLAIASGALTAGYYKKWQMFSPADLSRAIVQNPIGGRLVDENPALPVARQYPFFYEDNRHVFYVTTAHRLVTIREWQWWIPDLVVATDSIYTPPIKVKEVPPKQRVEITPDLLGPIVHEPGFGVKDPSPATRFITEDIYIKRGIETAGTVQYGDKSIGPIGSLSKGNVQQ